MTSLGLIVWGMGLLICNIACGAPIHHLGDLGAKVQWKKKNRILRHLGHQHQVTLFIYRYLM
jgi:hypothetical protein